MQALGRRVPFAFLEDTQQRFFATFGDGAQSAAAYEYEAQFSRVRSAEKDCKMDTVDNRQEIASWLPGILYRTRTMARAQLGFDGELISMQAAAGDLHSRC